MTTSCTSSNPIKCFQITDELPTERMMAWYRLTRIQENVREKHPGVTTALAGNDKLLVDDKMVTWDINKKKIVTKPIHTLPRRDKNRLEIRAQPEES